MSSLQLSSFQIGKRTFVSGLFWQLLSGPSGSHEQEAATLARQISADLGVFRNGPMRQVGLCSSSSDAKPGYSSAAAIVSKTIEMERLGQNALVALPIPDGRFLLIIIEQGELLPEGDLIGDETAVHSHLYNVFADVQWDVVIAPTRWGVSGAMERTFESFLPKNFAKGFGWWNLAPVGERALKSRRRKRTAVVVAAALITGLGMAGASYYKKVQAEAEQRRLAEIAAAEAEAARQRQMLLQQEKPWKKKPSAVEAAAACESAMDAVPIAPGGWSRESLVCDLATNLVSATFKRGEIMQAGWLPPNVIPDLTGQTASYVAPLRALKAGQQEAAIPAETARRHVMARIQTIGANAPLVVIEPPMTPAQNGKPPQPIPVDWTGWTFNFTTLLQPTTVVSQLAMPTLRINKITYGAANEKSSGGLKNWLIEGEIYATK